MKLPHWIKHDWERWVEIETGQVGEELWRGGRQIGEQHIVGSFFRHARVCATCGLKQVRTIRTTL